MKLNDIKKIAIIGAGNMGRQIATLCAIKGYRTFCTDTDKKTLDKATEFFSSYVASRVEKGKLTDDQAKISKKNISFTHSLEEAVNTADFVIEAIIEVLSVKRELFAKVDHIAPKHAILTTNSSYIVSSKIADATKRSEKVCNMHFFNPALAMKLVEIVKGQHVSEETADLVYNLSEKLGKNPVIVEKEVEGFLVNRILRVIRLEAYWLKEMGIASVEDIDKACVYGLGHPMGPFKLNDLTGLDLSYTQAIEKFKSTGEIADLPYSSLVQKFTQGKYGKKTGEGWYKY
ncbi:3-hydroxyacyl-CoA dehydrogenase family protein [uncultured Desulfosarcina sp.]|uniref:3-hydroxyacyl-CoA dehydrogenase family protein n=1 Tax=uncultured Desulfosarcina sp. TaxID=218289 RepID=UPI0029C713EA|nr:3-hydroxyacyl-CoA dehydrogenase family protein [uncultured Desulfosarcina sp.]